MADSQTPPAKRSVLFLAVVVVLAGLAGWRLLGQRAAQDRFVEVERRLAEAQAVGTAEPGDDGTAIRLALTRRVEGDWQAQVGGLSWRLPPTGEVGARTFDEIRRALAAERRRTPERRGRLEHPSGAPLGLVLRALDAFADAGIEIDVPAER